MEIINEHGFSLIEIYPEISVDEIFKHIEKHFSKKVKNKKLIKDNIRINSVNKKSKEKTKIYGREPSLFFSYKIEKEYTSNFTIKEKSISQKLEKISEQNKYLNILYNSSPKKFIKNPKYQSEVIGLRDIVFNHIPFLKKFYQNYKNINVFQIYQKYKISIFHLDYMKIFKDHQEDEEKFNTLNKMLNKLTSEQLQSLNSIIKYFDSQDEEIFDIYIKNINSKNQSNDQLKLLNEKNTEKNNKNKNKKYFIIDVKMNIINENDIISKSNTFNLEEESDIMDDYDDGIIDDDEYEDSVVEEEEKEKEDNLNMISTNDMNDELLSNNVKDDILNQIYLCLNICQELKIPRYVIKYVHGIDFIHL